MATTDAGLSSLSLATYSTNTYYSTFFGGSGYLTTPSGSQLEFGANNFTIELWWYPTNTVRQAIYHGSFGTDWSIGIDYNATGTNKIGIWASSNGTSWNLINSDAGGNGIGTITPTQNAWNHVAYVRNGTTWTLYVNGLVSVSVTGLSGTIISRSSSTKAIGCWFSTGAMSQIQGYISNFRILNGTALYTSAFNSPITQLTAIANTALLICNTNTFTDSSVNNLTITVNGGSAVGFKQFTPLLQSNASVTLSPTFSTGTLNYTFSAPANVQAISVTPTANDSTYSSIKFNSNVALTSGQSTIATQAPFYNLGYSANFVSGMLQYANAPQLNTNGYSWTVELWVNPTGNYANYNTLFAKRVSASGTTAYEGFLAITTGYISFYNGTQYNSSYTLPANIWSHVAYTYDGTQVSIYVNGNKVYGAAVTITDNTEPLTIGGDRGFTEWTIGNISNFRMVKGYVIYTQTFTPPSSPLGLTQSSGTGIRAISGAPTNGNSGYFNGASAYITSPASSVFPCVGDFTIELWTYLIAWPVIPALAAQYATGSTGVGEWIILVNTTGTVVFYFDGASNFVTTSTTAVLTLNNWYHIAVARKGTTTTIYINGVAAGSSALASGITVGSSSLAVYIGNYQYAPASHYMQGYISNFRWVNGTAVYTSNFMPSTTPLTAITNTTLLALQTTLTKDNSTNNFTMVVTGANSLVSVNSPFNSAGAASTQFLGTALAYQQVSNPFIPALSLGQGQNNFTAEAWVYLTAVPPTAPGWYIIQKGTGSTPGLEWSFSVTSTGLYFQTTSGIPTGTTTSTAFTANITYGQWMHLALTKVGTSVNVWFNGFYLGTVNGVNNFFYSTNPASYITIANTQTGATTAFSGYISNARVVYGKALYTVNYDAQFTPPTTVSLTQNTTSTVASIDNANNYTVVNGSSVYFNNTNDFLTFPEPSNPFASVSFGGSDYLNTPAGLATSMVGLAGTTWTMDCWVYSTSYNSANGYGTGVIGAYQAVAANGRWIFGYTGSAGITATPYFAWTTGTGSQTSVVSTGTFTLNTWSHIAVTIDSTTSSSTTIVLYINGVGQTFTGNDFSTQSSVYGSPSIAGNMSQYTNNHVGYLNSVRIIKGSIIYTGNFAVPTTPPVSTSATLLLACQSQTITKDNSSYAYTLTSSGTPSSIIMPSPYSNATQVTIEAWVLLGTTPTTRGWIINNSVGTAVGAWGIAVEPGRAVTFWSDANVSAVLTTTAQLPLYTWTHLALTFINNNVYIYFNGIRDTNTYLKTTVWQPATLSNVYVGRISSGAVQYFPGYITNLRMVYGTAVYTGKFTVPTSPLTAIANTVFLGLQSSVTLDSSTNNATVTKGSGATGLILSPLTSPFTTYLPSVSNGYSVAFGYGTSTATTDYLSVSTGYVTSTQLPGDFTIESWLYMAVMPATGATIIDTRAATTDAGYIFYVLNTGVLRFDSSNAAVLTGTTVLAPNTWYHLAVVRQNTLLRFFINGIPETTTVTTTADFGVRTVSTISVGRSIAPAYWSGYLNNTRLIIGTAIYTGTFTPSLIPYSITTPSSTNILAVGSIITYPALGNPNGVTYSGSYYFGGGQTTTNISIPNTNIGRFEVGIYDFTIEAWFYCTATTSGTYTIIGAGNSSSGYTDYAWSLYLGKTSITAGTLGFQSYIGSSSFNPTYAGTINSNQWYHVAVVRIGSSFNMYLNGVNVATSTIFNTPAYQQIGGTLSASTTIVIGAIYSSAPYVNNFYGYISNVRVIRGYGVYTGAFTPPTNILTNTQSTGSIVTNAITGTSTSLLALQNSTTGDSSSNAFTLTATGTPTLSSTVFPQFTVTNGYSGLFAGGSSVSVNGGLTGALNGLTSGTTGDYTIECWVYMTSLPTGTDYGSAQNICGTSDFRTSIGLIIGITTVGYLLAGRAGYTNVTNPIPSINTWAHLAFVNAGTVTTIYLNGVALSNTVSLPGTWSPSTATSTSYVGSAGYGSFNGYISNFRAVAGVQVYTGNFTVPTSPLTATQSAGTNISAITAGQTKLLVLQNSLTTDASASNYTLTTTKTTFTDVVLSKSNSPFLATNGNSVQFTGSSQYLNAPSNSAFTFGTGDFTIEGWLYISSGNTGTLYDSRTGASTVSPQIYISLYTLNYAVAGTSVITGSVLSLLTWYHIAVVRISGSTKLYVNGTQSGSTYTDSNNYVIGSPYIGTGYNTSNPLAGYISNLRVVKGLGVYTNNFTVPINALSSTQSSSSSTIALSNAIPILGNSVYFNGTTDYMKVPSNTSAMGTGDFTIEIYYYPTSFAAVTTLFGQYTAATTGLGYWNVQVTTAGIITVYYNGSTNFTASTAILVNEWVHIALVRISGTITLYVNGVSYGTVSFATQFGLSSVASPLHIGATQLSGPTQYALGYMSNLRIVRGVGVYTGAFTVPTSPLSSTQSSGTNITAISGSSTSLLLYQNSPFTDNSTYSNAVLPFGNPQYSPVFSPSYFTYPTPINGNSGYFNGTTSYLSLTQPSNAGTGDFTVELWVYPTSLAATGYLLSTSTTAANCFHLWVTTTGVINLALDSATATISSASPTSIRTYTWSHIAITRSGSNGVIYMYINGVRQTSTTTKTTQFGDTGVLNVGRYLPTPGQYFAGYITNVRFTYGYALYAGVFFTPNIYTPLTNVTGTTLLLLQSTITKDNSTNNVTVTNNSVLLSTYTNPYTMFQLPVILTGQNSRDLTSVTGFRDNSMYNAIMTSGSLSYASHQNTVSPFGVTPTLLLAQSSVIRDDSINNYSIAVGSTPNLMPYVTPFSGNAIAFNGSTQYITGASLYNSLGGDFTIEFFMMASPQTSAVGGLILGKNLSWSVTTNNNYYVMCSAPGGVGKNSLQTIQIYSSVISTTSPVYVGTIPVCNSKWHHIAIVRINNIVTIYIDGVIDTGTLSTSNRFYNSTVWDYSSYTIGSNANDGGSTVAQLAYNGMLSNLRIINGTGIYTGAFTPPTNTLTTSQTSGTNIVAYTPTSPSTNSYSLSFRGIDNAYLTTTNSYGTFFMYSDYTVEFYHYLTSRPTNSTSFYPCLFSNGTAYVGSLNMYAGHGSFDITKYQILFDGTTNGNWFVSNTSIIYGKWVHIAVVRRSGIVYLYINGILDSTSIYGANLVYGPDITGSNSGGTWTIGNYQGSTSTYISGFISNFRVVKGIAVYSGTSTTTTNFTVPTSPLTLTQSSSTNIAAIPSINTGNAYTNSLIMAGSGYVTTTNTTSYLFNTGYSDWTVEGWVFLLTMPTVDTWASGCQVFFGADSSLTTGTHCVIGATQMFMVISNIKFGSAIHGMVIGTWYHIAYVRISNNIYFYKNGVQLGSVLGVMNSTVTTTTTTYIGSANVNNYTLQGLISNLRYIRGLGIYTGSFTTPVTTLSLTSNSVTPVTAITGTSTSLLVLQNSITNDASSNNFTLTPATSVTLSTLSPFAVPNSLSASLNGTSYLTTSYSLNWSTLGPYTLEFYVYHTALSATNQTYASTGTTGYTNFYNYGSAGTYPGAVAVGIQGTNEIRTANNTITANTWYHIAYTYDGTTTNIYVNGVQQTTVFSGSTAVYSNNSASLVIASGLTTQPVFGYMTNFRLVKGTPVYTGNFTVPVNPLALTQSSGTNINAISGIQTYSINFNGTNQYITVPANSNFAFGTGDFTIEFWINSTDTAGGIFTPQAGNGSPYWALILNSSNLYWQTAYGAVNLYNNTATSIFNGAWHHVAVVRYNGTNKMYFDGVAQANSASDSTNYTGSSLSYGIGYDYVSGGNSGYFAGYISNFRIIKGTAQYTANFTPPTTNLTAISGTVLLIAQSATIVDNSTNAYTITNVNTATVSSTIYPLLSSNTQILSLQSSITLDSSVNNSNITLTGAPFMTSTVTPFAPTTNGYSAYFTSAGISVPSNSVFTFGTGDLTIEAWVYMSGITPTGTIFDGRTSATSVHPVLYINSYSIRYAVAGTDVIVGSTLSATTWYHVAIVRISGVTKLYVNGIQSGSSYTDTNNYLITGPSIGSGYGNSNILLGYISNLRVVNGLGVYTNRFGVPSTPLTSTQSTKSNVLALSKLALNNNSIFYNGSSYHSVPNNALYILGLSDFTVEAWIYLHSTSSAYSPICQSDAVGSSTNDKWFFAVSSSNTLVFSTHSSGGFSCSISFTPLLYSWYHVAAVRLNGVVSLFVNGVSGLVTTTGTPSGYLLNQNGLTIGGMSTPYYMTGYISNLRITKLALYTGSFTTSTTPLTNYQSLGTNIVALTKTNTTITNGNSILFNGSTDYLRVTNYSALNFASNDYCIECYFYTTTVSTTQMILSKVSNKSTYDFYLRLNADDGTGTTVGAQLEFYQGNTVNPSFKTLMGAIAPNTWNHVAIVRAGTTAYYLYINGVYDSIVSPYVISSINPYYDPANDLNIGVNGVDYNSNFFSGYITNVRITNGTYIYTSSPSAFPVLQAPLQLSQAAISSASIVASISAQTAFLGLQTTATNDSSINNASITAYGSPTVSTTVYPFTLRDSLGYALYFNGTNNSNNTASPNLPGYVDFFNSNVQWTIEMWYYQGNGSSTAADGTLVSFYTSNANDVAIRANANKAYYVVTTSANNQSYLITSSTNAVAGWNHLALVKHNGIVTMYLNGAVAGTTGSIPAAAVRGGPGLGYDPSFGQPFTGYISNFRIVRDNAVYTGPFTVSTVPLTHPQVIPSTIGAITSGQTSLLVLQSSTTTDNSGNSLNLTATGTPTLSTTNGPQFPGVLGYSGFFGGSPNYLVGTTGTGGLAALTSGTTGDYTVECWVYMTASPSGTGVSTMSTLCASTGGTGSGPIYFAIGIITTGYIVYDRAGNAVTITGTIPTLNTWAHLAFVNAGTTMNIYLNGTKLANTGSVPGTWTGTGTLTIIGMYGTAWSTSFFTGYISNFRAVSGVQVYTGNFTVPTGPLSATQSAGTNISAITSGQTKLLMLQTNNVSAESAGGYTFTNYGNGVGAFKLVPFVTATNGYSVAFTGSTQYLNAPSNAAFTFGTGDFTIEAWVYLASGTTGTIYDGRTGASTVSPQLYITGSNLCFGAAGTVRITNTFTLSTTTWYHVAASRVSGVTTIYVNGMPSGTPYVDTNNYVIGSPYIGTGFGSSNPLVGSISNLRVVKGVGIYTSGFFTPTSPLSATQSTGPNTSIYAYTLILQSGQADATSNLLASFGTATTFNSTPILSPFYLSTYMPSIIFAQGPTVLRDNSIFFNRNITLGTGNSILDRAASPFNSSVALLTGQASGVFKDNGPSNIALSSPGSSASWATFNGSQSPFVSHVGTVFLTAQSNSIANTGLNSSADASLYNYVYYGANTSASTLFGPFNSDTPLLTLQNPVIVDNSNVRSSMTVVGGGVSPTDSSPFTTSKSLTGLLIPFGYNDISINNTTSNYIANNANVAQTNFTYNPASIPSTLVSVLALQSSNILIDNSINNGVFTTANTAPTSNTNSPFGTYYSNGLLILNTNSTTGIYGSNIINYANLLVTANDTVTTNTYSITVTSLNNVGNIGNRAILDTGGSPTQSNANITLSDLGNSNINEATILTFANTSITPTKSTVDYGINVAPSNTTFVITDVANSNITETLSNVFVSGVSIGKIYIDSGLGQVAPSNTTFVITDVANSNITETIANVTISNVSTIRSIVDTGTQPPPSPVGGTILFPTYSYTDGYPITAANVQGSYGGGSTSSNQQIWYQT